MNYCMSVSEDYGGADDIIISAAAADITVDLLLVVQ